MKVQRRIFLVCTLSSLALAIGAVVAGHVLISSFARQQQETRLVAELDGVMARLDTLQNELIDSGTAGIPEFDTKAQKKALDALQKQTTQHSEKIIVAKSDLSVVFHPTLAPGQAIKEIPKETLQARENFFQASVDGQQHYMHQRYFEPWDWHVAIGVSEKELNAPRNRFIWSISAISALLFLALSWISQSYFNRWIVAPIRNLTLLAQKVSKGDVSSTIDISLNNGEITELERAFAQLALSNRAKTDAVKAIADGALQTEIPISSNLDGLGNSLHAMVESLRRIKVVKENSDVLTIGIARVTKRLSSNKENLEAQRGSLSKVIEAMSQLNHQKEQSTQLAVQSTALAQKAREQAEGGATQVQELVDMMSQIEKAASEIAKITKLIDSIAFQTNLLALNASVEAARAGKHGKGFAVVAEEVRNLAQRSSKAAQETATKVGESLTAVRQGSESVQSTVQSLQNVGRNTIEIAERLTQIASLSQQEMSTLDDATHEIQTAREIVNKNTTAIESITSSLESLSSCANDLEQTMAGFQFADS